MEDGDLEILVIGWFLGIIGAFVVPHIKDWYDEKKAIGRFKKQLRLELSNNQKEIQEQLKSHISYFKIKNTDELTSIEIAVNSLDDELIPAIIRADFQTRTYDNNSNLLVFLEDEIQMKISDVYITIRFLNSIPRSIQEINNNITRRQLLINHIYHLNKVSQEINGILLNL